MNFKEYLEINQKKEDEIEVQLILDQKTRNSKIVLF